MELKLTGITLNRSEKGVQVGFIFIKNSLVFLNSSRNRFFPYKSLLFRRYTMVAETLNSLQYTRK